MASLLRQAHLPTWKTAVHDLTISIFLPSESMVRLVLHYNFCRHGQSIVYYYFSIVFFIDSKRIKKARRRKKSRFRKRKRKESKWKKANDQNRRKHCFFFLFLWILHRQFRANRSVYVDYLVRLKSSAALNICLAFLLRFEIENQNGTQHSIHSEWKPKSHCNPLLISIHKTEKKRTINNEKSLIRIADSNIFEIYFE